MMEHAHFKIDSDLRQKKEALWAIETPHQKKKSVTLSQNHFEEDVFSCLYLRHYVLGIT